MTRQWLPAVLFWSALNETILDEKPLSRKNNGAIQVGMYSGHFLSLNIWGTQRVDRSIALTLIDSFQAISVRIYLAPFGTIHFRSDFQKTKSTGQKKENDYSSRTSNPLDHNDIHAILNTPTREVLFLKPPIEPAIANIQIYVV